MIENKLLYSLKYGRARYPELYESLSWLKEKGLTLDELGRVYVSYLSEKTPGKMLNKLRSLIGVRAEQVKRHVKKDIQKDTRHYFSEIKNNIAYHELKLDEIVPDFDIGIAKDKFERNFKRSDTIEAVVSQLLNDRAKGFEKIGGALIEGTQKYKRKKGGITSPHLYKLFIEYDEILKALKDKMYSRDLV